MKLHDQTLVIAVVFKIQRRKLPLRVSHTHVAKVAGVTRKFLLSFGALFRMSLEAKIISVVGKDIRIRVLRFFQ